MLPWDDQYAYSRTQLSMETCSPRIIENFVRAYIRTCVRRLHRVRARPDRPGSTKIRPEQRLTLFAIVVGQAPIAELLLKLAIPASRANMQREREPAPAQIA